MCLGSYKIKIYVERVLKDYHKALSKDLLHIHIVIYSEEDQISAVFKILKFDSRAHLHVILIFAPSNGLIFPEKRFGLKNLKSS